MKVNIILNAYFRNPSQKYKAERIREELEKLGAKEIPILTIYNKIDVLTTEEKQNLRKTGIKDAIFISAKNNENVELLKEKLLEILWQ